MSDEIRDHWAQVAFGGDTEALDKWLAERNAEAWLEGYATGQTDYACEAENPYA